MKPIGSIEKINDKRAVLLKALIDVKTGDELGFNAYTCEAGINSVFKVKSLSTVNAGDKFYGEMV